MFSACVGSGRACPLTRTVSNATWFTLAGYICSNEGESQGVFQKDMESGVGKFAKGLLKTQAGIYKCPTWDTHDCLSSSVSLA